MIFFQRYIEQFENDLAPERRQLAGELSRTGACFDIFQGGDPEASLGDFIGCYNWLGTSETKVLYGINQNLARNLVGSMFQDYLLNLCIKICRPFPNLDTFTESRISFGRYPLWQAGTVTWASPSEYSDIAIVYLMENEEIVPGADAWPKPPRIRVDPGQKIIPLVTINSKIRVSQSEFFDWHGREQLMTKGNPHCFSIQVVLRKEMDMSIVEATQAAGKFFLLGGGGERNVAARPGELERLVAAISGHLQAHMLP